jgi:hypothetical protein
MRAMRRLAPAVLVALACSRAPEPSPELAAAQQRRADVLAAHPGDAAARPEMDEVLALLARVPPDSPDAAAAAELRARVEAERAALAAEAAARAEAVERAGRPSPVAPAPAAEPAGGGAGPAPAGGLRLARGTKLADFRAAAGACFEKKVDLEIVDDGKARPGEAWGLRDGEECARQHPRQAGQWVLFADGALVSSVPSASAKTVTARAVGERVEKVDVVPLPGGQYGRRTADGKVEPLPAGTKVVQEPAAPAPGARP